MLSPSRTTNRGSAQTDPRLGCLSQWSEKREQVRGLGKAGVAGNRNQVGYVSDSCYERQKTTQPNKTSPLPEPAPVFPQNQHPP